MVNESCKFYKRYFNTPSIAAKKSYYYIEWSGHFVCNPDFCINRQDYRSILILQTVSGQGKLHYRGKEYLLTKESIAIINCMDFHKYFPASDEDWSFRFLHLSGNKSMEMYEHIYEINGGALFDVNEEFERYIEGCMRLCKEKGVAYEVKISKIISDIFHEIILHIQQDERDKISIVCDYIANNYMQPLSTETLAKISYMSRCYLSTVFKKSMGFTLHNYLLHYRLDKAKILLCEKNLSISRVAENTGFNNVDSFIRFFKKTQKTTPAQYRKQKTVQNQ